MELLGIAFPGEVIEFISDADTMFDGFFIEFFLAAYCIQQPRG